MNHSKLAIQYREGSTWNLDDFAEDRNWKGVDIALSQNRDSDALERSNWQVIETDLVTRFGDTEYTPYIEGKGEQYLSKDIAVASLNHWAVGWVEHLCFNTARKDIAKAVKEWGEKLDNYPVADEMHWSKLEWDENHPTEGYFKDKCLNKDCDCGLEKV